MDDQSGGECFQSGGTTRPKELARTVPVSASSNSSQAASKPPSASNAGATPVWRIPSSLAFKRNYKLPPLHFRNSNQASRLLLPRFRFVHAPLWAGGGVTKLTLIELSEVVEARQRLDSQQSENELVLKVGLPHSIPPTSIKREGTVLTK